ncbi:hypothetical protein VNI00_015601 [Paramarasmius palmivorus]|uniref:N-acetyltransferase domain-containing protein n=1 Tax=Paramarasmius palmivorus TaxID=297713 RepID=A0AAW0BIC0_9AGAR
MSKVPVHRIEELTEAELEHAVAIHVKAYEGGKYASSRRMREMTDPATDLSMKVMLGGDLTLVPDLGRAMIRATLLEGCMYAVKGDSGDICPARGKELTLDSEAQRAVGFNDLFKKFSAEQQQWFIKTVKSAHFSYPEARKNHVETLFTDEERLKRWWCASLVTDPDHQGRGYGKAIVNTLHKKASESKRIPQSFNMSSPERKASSNNPDDC